MWNIESSKPFSWTVNSICRGVRAMIQQFSAICYSTRKNFGYCIQLEFKLPFNGICTNGIYKNGTSIITGRILLDQEEPWTYHPVRAFSRPVNRIYATRQQGCQNPVWAIFDQMLLEQEELWILHPVSLWIGHWIPFILSWKQCFSKFYGVSVCSTFLVWNSHCVRFYKSRDPFTDLWPFRTFL